MLSGNENVIVQGGTFVQARDIIQNFNITTPSDESAAVPKPSGGYHDCIEGTRTKVLEDIMSWINANPNDKPSQLTSKYTRENPTILWLTGPAGIGKSAIARTLKEKCFRLRIRGAACFCPEEGINKDPQKILPSVVDQLRRNQPSSNRTFQLLDPDSVANVIKDDFNNPRIQANRLLVEPLQEMREQGQDLTRFVVIIDALDECLDPGEFIPNLMSSIAENLENYHPLRFIITSRPRPNLKRIIERNHSRIIPLALDQVDPQVVKTDIRTYLNHSLKPLHLRVKLTTEQLDILVEASGGLFVFAFTCMQFIEDPYENNPSGQLKKLLGWLSRGRSSEDPSIHIMMRGLDELYSKILEQNPKPPELHESDRALKLKSILGAVVLALHPLSLTTLDKLLNLEMGTTRGELEQLHAVVLFVPLDWAQDKQADYDISLHTSFADFLKDSQRCTNPVYSVDVWDEHANMAYHCLRIWGRSKFVKIAKEARVLDDPTALIKEEERKAYAAKVPGHVKYAVEYWGYHLASSRLTCKIMEKLHAICTSHSDQILYWIEMCASLNLLRAALSSLSLTRKTIEEIGGNSEATELYPPSQRNDLCIRLEKIETWVRRFYTIINNAPLQVHHLVYSPHFFAQPPASSIRELAYAGTITSTLLPAKYDSGDTVRSVATFVSQTGDERVIAASGSHLEIWDILADTKVENIRTDHKGRIWSIAVSPDMKYVASGSSDTTVKIWDLSGGGRCIWTFCGHEEMVTAVSFSPTKALFVADPEDSDSDEGPDSSGKGAHWKVVSGDANGTLIRWEIGGSVEREQVFKGHTAAIRAVSYFESAEACVILSGSEDGVVLLWDMSRGSNGRSLLPSNSAHAAITSAVISPRNHTVMACATADGLAYRWEGKQDKPTIIQSGFSGRDDNSNAIGALAFTSNGRAIAFSQGDYLYINSLYGSWKARIPIESGPFRSLAFTPNNYQIVGAAGSRSSIIYLWRSKKSFEKQTSSDEQSSDEEQPGPDERLTYATISSNQELALLGWDSGHVQLWSLKVPGQLLMESTLRDSAAPEAKRRVLSAAFSTGNTRLVIGVGPREDNQGLYGGKWLYRSRLDSEESLKPQQLADNGPHCERPGVEHIELLLDGAQFAYPAHDGVYVWCPDGRRRIYQCRLAKKKEDATTSAFSFSPDGTRMAVARSDGQIAVFDIVQGQLEANQRWPPFDFGRSFASDISFTSDGKGVIAMTRSRDVALIRVDDGKVVRVIGDTNIIEPQEDPSLFDEFREVVAAIDKLKAPDAGWIGIDANSSKNEWHRDYTNKKIVEYLSGPQSDQNPVLVVKGQWFWCIRRQRRIMPIPASLEEGRVAQAGKWVVMGSHRSGVHMLDISAMVKKLDELGRS